MLDNELDQGDILSGVRFGLALLAYADILLCSIWAIHRIRQTPVNDNFGRWQSDFAKLLAYCLHDGVRGQPLAERLRPDPDDYFVLKPKHSGFYATTLDLLLRYLHVTTVILTGLTGDICVLFTANDAYMRDFQLVVPGDCVVSQDAEENHHALRHMQRVLKADIQPSTALDLHGLRYHSGGQR